MTESGNGTAARAETGWAIRLAHVTARLAEHRFTSHDGDGLVEAVVDGNGDPVAVVLTNRAVRLLSEAALGARVVAALDRARARADEVAAPLLAERLGAMLPVAPPDLADDSELLAAVETAHDTTGTVTATVNAHGELYDVRLARQVLELDRAVLATRIAAAETAAYHAALRSWASSPRHRRSR